MKTSAVAIAAIAITLCAVPADAQVQERTIRWGHLNNTDHPVSLGVQKFAEILAAKSGGKLKVREFPASQLGNEMQMQSALRGGTRQRPHRSQASSRNSGSWTSLSSSAARIRRTRWSPDHSGKP
jgi:TRAP-type C4-dicarboxylate transport system substrate-binding protein